MADHQKLLLGAAAASLAALGIVFIASSVELPTVTIEPTKVEKIEKVDPAPSIPSPPPPPAPKPQPVRPHPAPSR
jgi:hypothetical protein